MAVPRSYQRFTDDLRDAIRHCPLYIPTTPLHSPLACVWHYLTRSTDGPDQAKYKVLSHHNEKQQKHYFYDHNFTHADTSHESWGLCSVEYDHFSNKLNCISLIWIVKGLTLLGHGAYCHWAISTNRIGLIQKKTQEFVCGKDLVISLFSRNGLECQNMAFSMVQWGDPNIHAS